MSFYQFRIDPGRAYQWISLVGFLRWMVIDHDGGRHFSRYVVILHLMHALLMRHHICFASILSNIGDCRRISSVIEILDSQKGFLDSTIELLCSDLKFY